MSDYGDGYEAGFRAGLRKARELSTDAVSAAEAIFQGRREPRLRCDGELTYCGHEEKAAAEARCERDLVSLTVTLASWDEYEPEDALDRPGLLDETTSPPTWGPEAGRRMYRPPV